MLGTAKGRAIAIQVLVVAIAAAALYVVGTATAANLKAKGIPLGWDFLFRPAGFQIAETILPYSPRDPNWWAAIVGIANSLFVSVLVVVFASFLGLAIGIARLSPNPLVRGTARCWVEIARNTPVIVLLIFTYSIWWKLLPQSTEAWHLAPGTHLSLRGLVLPAIRWEGAAWLWWMALAWIVVVAAASRIAAWRQAATGVRPPFVLASVAGGLLMLGAAALSASDGIVVEFAEYRRGNFFGGWQITPELTTILVGLTFYTAGFIGEIVRGGILAIPRGQWDAARALSLRRGQIYRLVVVPQALRAIVPPLNSQYINVVKNSTLAIAVGYQDFMTVMGTVINRTSHAIEGIVMILGVFLVLNLALSSLMNWYNRRIAIVER
ncbi:MAG: polar amino acid ABC transporter permease [Tagaea sp. CACIAM 22H2]|nr:polar amino acid ABC transporter permease [Tagaea sp. CACIAM 22H2]